MPTLRELRRALADRVAPYQLMTAGAESPAGAWSGTSLDANRRRLASSDLVSLDATGVMAEAPPDALKAEWAYLLTDPPQQRRIPEAGYNGFARVEEVLSGSTAPPADEIGYLDVERPFASVVAAGTPFELHGIPPLRGGRSPGLHAAINKALRVILREDTVAVPAVAGRHRYDVTATFPWLSNPWLFVGCEYATTDTAGPDAYTIPGATLRFDADATLLFPNSSGASGSSFPVRVLRPLSTWIKPAGGSWGESTAGLVSELDACLGETDSIALVAAVTICEAEADLCAVGSAERLAWLGKAASFAQRTPFLRDQRVRRPRQGPYPFPDLVSVDGPLGGRWGCGFR